MKSSFKILFVFIIIFAMMIGLFIGLSFKIGEVSQSEIAGTMARINNYKKAQSSISGNEIEKQLLKDTVRLKNMQNYLRYNYTSCVKMADDIRFAIGEANAVESFKKTYSKEIDDLVNYEKTFAMARIDLLIALRACVNPEKTNPLLLSEFVNQATNVIAMMNYRNRVVLDFIDILELHIKENNTLKLTGLTKAHDLLMYNELNNSLKSRDRLVLNSFNKKGYLSTVKNQKLVDDQNIADLIRQDLEKLTLIDGDIPGLNDSKKLGLDDVEKLGFMESEKLINYIPEKIDLSGKVPGESVTPFWNY